MPIGTVLSGVGGFYRVQAPEGDVRPCVPRGRIKREFGHILAGDRVEFSTGAEGQCVVERILPRRTEFVRPAIANIDQAVVVTAAADPAPNPSLIDRLLVLVEHGGLEVVLCVNKVDLSPVSAAELTATYERIGYQVVQTSAKRGDGVDRLVQLLANHTSTLTGPSGVGKSAIINAIDPRHQRETGEISERLGRGRHTTRAVELLPLAGGGWIADTPGFSQLSLTHLPKGELFAYFPEMNALAPQCRFGGCLHRDEPGCAVKQAVTSGSILESRYKNYLIFLAEIQEHEERRYS